MVLALTLRHRLLLHLMCCYVHCAACGVGGCATVVGIMLELAEDPEAASNEFINTIWDVMPTVESVRLKELVPV